MIQFNKKYFLAFIVLFVVELGIAKYATGFLRHTIGDVLATMFLYCLIKSFINSATTKTLLIVLVISFAIEFLQLSNLQNLYPNNLKNTLRIILGTSFSIGDLIAYTCGILITYYLEKNKK